MTADSPSKRWVLWILDLDRTWMKVGEFEREAEAERERKRRETEGDRIYLVRHISSPPTMDRI